MITSAWVVKNVTVQYCTHPDDHIQTSLIYFKSVFSKSYGDLIYFEFGRNFRLEILMVEAKQKLNITLLFYLSGLSLFICFYHRSLKMFSFICIFLIKNQWFE